MEGNAPGSREACVFMLPFSIFVTQTEKGDFGQKRKNR